MKIYIELSSLEEGREALEALQMYKEANQGSVLFQQKKEEEPKKEEPKLKKQEAGDPNRVVNPAFSMEDLKELEAEKQPEKQFPELAEVRARVKALQEKVGKDETKKLLAEFDAKGASSVPEESREAFIARAEEVLGG